MASPDTSPHSSPQLADTVSAEGAAHPWHRMVSIGDSFTEGVGDPDDLVPGGNRGWADRVAEELGRLGDDFAYANLAIRGRLFQPIIDEQLEPALELHPDLVTVCAGGNDLLRPSSDPDDLAQRMEAAVEKIVLTGATVVMFTSADVGNTPVLRAVRGRAAIFNENLRVIAARHGAVMVSLWGLQELRDPSMWATDRLHLSPLGHQLVACETLDSLGVDHGLVPGTLAPRPDITWRQARTEDLVWARKYFVPWVGRRIRRRSSGDYITAKRPEFGRAIVPQVTSEHPEDSSSESSPEPDHHA